MGFKLPNFSNKKYHIYAVFNVLKTLRHIKNKKGELNGFKQ